MCMMVALIVLACPTSAEAKKAKKPEPTAAEIARRDSLIEQAKASTPEFIRKLDEKYHFLKYKDDGTKVIDWDNIDYIKEHPLSKKYLLWVVAVAAGIAVLASLVLKDIDEDHYKAPPLWMRMGLCGLCIVLFVMELIYFIFPNEGGHGLYFLMPSQVGWLMVIIDFFLMIGIIIGQYYAYAMTQFSLHKSLVPLYSALIINALCVLTFAVYVVFKVEFLQKHLEEAMLSLLLIHIVIIIFYNIKEKQPVQLLWEIPFITIGTLATTVFIGIVLAILGSIILGILLLLLILPLLSMLVSFPRGAVYSSETGKRVKREKDGKCDRCSYYAGAHCLRDECIDPDTRKDNDFVD